MQITEKSRPWFRRHDGWWYVTRRVNGKRVQIKLARGKKNKTLAYQRYHERGYAGRRAAGDCFRSWL